MSVLPSLFDEIKSDPDNCGDSIFHHLKAIHFVLRENRDFVSSVDPPFQITKIFLP